MFWIISRRNVVVIPVLAMCAAGCWSSGGPAPSTAMVQTSAFYRPIPGSEDPENNPVDKGGAIVSPVESRNVLPLVEKIQMPKPAPVATAVPTPVAGSTTAPAGGTTAQYLTVGAIVIEVSGTPIYADKVLQGLTPMLTTEAKQRDFDSYRMLARSQIDKRINDMISTEVYYAAASQNLTKEEKNRADAATMMWRKRLITEAGGSEILARQKITADGVPFDERVHEQYRRYIIELWYSKKVFPRVDVTAEDLRRYYDQHQKDFTDVPKAQFRIIKITAANLGGVDQARARITELRQQAAQQNDEEFAKTAGAINDPAFMKTGGRVGGGDGWVERGAFAVQQVEDAIWKLQPGQVTEVITVGDAFYIARLENRRDARVRQFDDQTVQAEIYALLSRPQVADQQDRMRAKLLQNAVFNPPIQFGQQLPDSVIKPVLEMALQKYSEWSGK